MTNETDDIIFIDSVWAYNKTKNRFQFDCKIYENNGKWYWLQTNVLWNLKL